MGYKHAQLNIQNWPLW